MAAQTGQKVFGSGRFYGIPNVTNPTPSPFGVTQDVSIDFKRDIKELFGQNQLPVDIAAGMLHVTGKVTNGTLQARLFNDLMIGGTLSTGQIPWVANETITISSGSTLGTPANAAGLVTDLGIYPTLTGVPLVRVSTIAILSAGQYAVSTAGVYAFSSLDSFTSLKVSYLYSTSGGQSVAMTNQPMGKTGNFQAIIDLLWGSDKGSISLGNCMAADWTLATKLDDYTKPSFDFQCGTDATDSLGTFSFAELS